MSDKLLNIARRAADAAGRVLRSGFQNRQNLATEVKALNDYVTKYDKDAEATIINKIRELRPDDIFLAEESSDQFDTRRFDVFNNPEYKNKVLWIVDPLDGTRNFILGIPHFAVSIAAVENGELVAAVVYNPVTEEEFTAVKGKGAKFNDFRIEVNKGYRSEGVEGRVLATGFCFKDRAVLAHQLPLLNELFSQHGLADIRRSGSAALDLCYVAAGRYDGYFEEGVCPWDIAAGALIVKEAKGLVFDYAAGNNYFKTKQVIAGNLEVARKLAQVFRKTQQQ